MTAPVFLTWLWEGRRPGVYKAAHVDALARMLRAHMSVPYRLVCVTDRPEGIAECETYPLWDLRVKNPNSLDCYRRLKLFDPHLAATFGERLVSIDLDVLIRADLAPLIDDALDFQGMRGMSSRINGSLWTLRVGSNRHVWDSFDPKHATTIIGAAVNPNGSKLVGSDQAWMSLTMPNAAVWEQSDGLWHFKRLEKQRDALAGARMVAFPGNVKAWDCAQRFPQLFEEYASYLR